MPGERRERPFIEPVNPQVEGSWLRIIDALTKQANIELYAFDAEDAAAFSREQGSGQLKLSGNGDLQIKQGKNWLVVKTLDDKLQKHLRLDEPSVRALTEYLQNKPKVEPYKHVPKKETEADNEKKELRRWRLEKLEAPEYLSADILISRILGGKRGQLGFVDITDNKPGGGKEIFCRAWKTSCGDVPMPCVPPKRLFKTFYPGQKFPDGTDEEIGNFDYLQLLADNRIVKNLASNRQISIPYFGKKETIYAMDWVEDDSGAVDNSGAQKLFGSHYESPLLEELGLSKAGVMRIDRKDIDEALWEGDPGLRRQTKKHKEILKKLGLNDHELEIHCIRQDQYARLAKAKKWGQHLLMTHFDDYATNPGWENYGLSGGHVDNGGASFVSNLPRVYPNNDVYATRLVISRKRHKF